MLVSRRMVLLSGCAFVAGCGGGGGDASPTPPPTSPAPPPAPVPPAPPPPPPPPPVVRVPFDFANGAESFTADFADYRPGQETGDAGIRFRSEVRRLPAPLDARTGLLVAGTNRSDDLFLYIWRPVTGLVPGQRYRVAVQFTVATNVPADCVGAGGSPGESVAIKAGASARLPTKSVQDDRVVTNIDKGEQFTSGREAIVVGDFTGGGGACGPDQGTYRPKTLSTAAPQPLPITSPPADALLITADPAGRLWIVIGTDSGFEDRTEIYVLEGEAVFTPV